MADLFDALAARALGTASTLVPTPVPRFGVPVPAQVQDGAALVSSDGPAPAPEPGPRPPEPAQPRADDPAHSPLTDPDKPQHTQRTVGRRDAGPNQGATELDREVEQPRGVARPRRPDGSGLEPAAAEADGPSAPRVPRRGARDVELPTEAAEPFGLPTAEPSTGRLRTAVSPERSGDTVTDSRPRPPYELDDRSAPGPAAAPSPPPQVTVSIGYVEVRAPARTPEPRTTPRTPRPEPRLSLQDYLRREGRR